MVPQDEMFLTQLVLSVIVAVLAWTEREHHKV